MTTDNEIIVDRVGNLGILTLNREKALNALTGGMIRTICKMLNEWEHDATVTAILIKGAGERAFCAGGDIKAAHEAGQRFKRGETDHHHAVPYFGEEYNFNRRLFHYKKPLIAFMDGIVMGGGYGIAGPCRYRIATPKTLFAMPEVGIGFFPDVGAMFFLTRAPGQSGAYLAVTGASVGPADAVYAGAANYYMKGVSADDLIKAFSAMPIDDVLRKYASMPEEESLLALQAHTINLCFAADSIEAILANLEKDGSAFALQTAQLIDTRCPMSLKVSLAHYLSSKGKSFDEVTEEDFSLAQHFMAGHDFYEGVRAMVIDKDRTPRWVPATLAEITDSAVNQYFTRAGQTLSENAS